MMLHWGGLLPWLYMVHIVGKLQGSGSSYNNSFSSRSFLRSHGNGQYTGPTKKYHSLPDISGYGTVKWDPPTGQEQDQLNPLVQRATGELDTRYRSLGSSSFKQLLGTFRFLKWGHIMMTLIARLIKFHCLLMSSLLPSFTEMVFSLQSTSKAENNSLWSRQPFEKLFGMSGIGSDQILVGQSNARINFK